ncbi:MAG: nitrogenase component 1 [Hornefia sp.]|nr:nitrogenase component 1 [Hornefia sp.]
MQKYLTSITPDSLSGLIFALEGIYDGVVLLNGPSGCKFYHSSLSDGQMIRSLDFDPLNYPEKWYFGQPHVPCTSIDNGDYVYGSEEKLRETLRFLRENVKFNVLFVVNSPGAALIGDDLRGIARSEIKDRPVIVYESPGFSENMPKGYVRAFEAAAEYVSRDESISGQGNSADCGGSDASKKVNIIGAGLWRRNFQGDVEELRRLCKMMDIEVNCMLMAGCFWQDICSLSDADLNIVIAPEFGEEIAKKLKTLTGTGYYICDSQPIGFKATEQWAREICEILDLPEPYKIIEESQRLRARCYPLISRLNSLTGMPTGRHFAVEGRYSEALGYSKFLLKYFGMTPDSISILDADMENCKEELENFLRLYGVEDSLKKPILDTDAEIVLASGNTIGGLKLKGADFGGIDISLPSLGYIDVIPKTHLGLSGAVLLVELVLNGLKF